VSISGWKSARCGTPNNRSTSGSTRSSAPQARSTSNIREGLLADSGGILKSDAGSKERLVLAEHGRQHREVFDDEAALLGRIADACNQDRFFLLGEAPAGGRAILPHDKAFAQAQADEQAEHEEEDIFQRVHGMNVR